MIDTTHATIYFSATLVIAVLLVLVIIIASKPWRKISKPLIAKIFRSWRYWHQYQPTWSIDTVEKIEVFRENQTGYYILAPILIKYTNNDPRYPLNFISKPILYVYHSGAGREGKVYESNTADQGSLNIAPDHSKKSCIFSILQ
ncbi:MAG: hypothetical protein ABSA18_01700 [Dehalococcoidia bacterium]